MKLRIYLSLLALATPVRPCTTVLIGKALTADGAVIHAHIEDMGNDAVGRLWAVPPATHEPGTMSVPYVELERPARTLGYWASGNAPGAAGLGTSDLGGAYDSVLVGLNERGVSMSCNWAHSREENREGVGIRRYAVRQILLERAESARHGVDLLGELIDTHGQADWGGLIYHLADPDEAWVVETTTHHWVARRVRDDEIRVTANRFRIGADFDLASAGLVEHAARLGWHRGGRFDFSAAYGKPEKMDQPYDTLRERRVEELLGPWTGPRGSHDLRPADLFPILRDRYEGTASYTPPQAGPVWREDLQGRPNVSRTLSTNLAQSTFVAHMRPEGVGPVLWFGFGTPSYTGYAPLYARPGAVPREIFESPSRDGGDEPWRLFRHLQRQVDADYEALYPDVREAWDEEHQAALATTRAAEARAVALLRRGRGDAADALLAAHSRERARRDLERARQLLERLAEGDRLRAAARPPGGD